MSTFSINTPPEPPPSPTSTAGSSDVSKLARQRERITAERDSALELNAQLKAEIEEEMQRGIELHKRCSDAEAKLEAAQRKITRLEVSDNLFI